MGRGQAIDMMTWKVVNIQLIKCVCGEGYKIWVHDGFTLIFKVTFKNMCVFI